MAWSRMQILRRARRAWPKGIAPSGALLVETEAGLKEVLSGDGIG